MEEISFTLLLLYSLVTSWSKGLGVPLEVEVSSALVLMKESLREPSIIFKRAS